jgi:alpha-glucosidase (family GH31 glycosyl hydrolase)
LQAVLDGYDKYNIPLDVSWSDIDYLNSYRDFEFDQDPKTFADLPTFVDMLHTKRNMKYVPIFDAGIAYRPNKGTYPAFDEAMTQDIFTKIDGKTFIGQVWPNDASFPDYFHPNTSTWFKSNLDKFYSSIKFDGLWEDMNEASNFCNGACYPDQQVANPVKNKLKYTPTGRDLEGKSMPLDTTHYNGYLQLDAHSYYGTQEVQVTNDWFKSKNMRTLIIDRSSFAGMGKFGSRWLGDNFSEEKFMGYSVSGTMMMNIFGITFTGSDICGFIGDTNPELCAKWHVLGAFYPFSRNHNNWGQLP